MHDELPLSGNEKGLARKNAARRDPLAAAEKVTLWITIARAFIWYRLFVKISITGILGLLSTYMYSLLLHITLYRW